MSETSLVLDRIEESITPKSSPRSDIESPRYKIINTHSSRSSPRRLKLAKENDNSPVAIVELQNSDSISEKTYVNKSLTRLRTKYTDDVYPNKMTAQQITDKIESTKSCPNFSVKVLKKN